MVNGVLDRIPGIGLSGRNASRAAEIDASARGVATPNPATPDGAPSAPEAAADQASDAAAGQARQSGIPQLGDRPLSALGLIAQETAAGIRGGLSPIAQLEEQFQQQQALELKRADFLINSVSRASELIRQARPDQKDAIIASLVPSIGIAAGGDFDIRGFLEDITTNEELALKLPQVGNLSPQAKQMFVGLVQAGEDPMTILADDKLMDRIFSINDQQQLPLAVQALDLLKEQAGARGLDGMTMTDLRTFNAQSGNVIPERLLDTIERSPELQARNGMITGLRFDAIQKTPSTVGRLQDERALATGDERQELDAAIDKQITITGRTEQDIVAGGLGPKGVDAADRVRGRAAGEATVRSQNAAIVAQRATNLLNELEQTGAAATGFLGTAGQTAGGIVGQFNETLGDLISEGLTGVSAAEISSIKRRTAALVAQSITEITGDDSGRFTDREQQLTRQALSVNETSSLPQLKRAIEDTAVFAFVSSQLDKIRAQQDVGNFSDPDVAKQIATQLDQSGFNDEMIVRTLKELVAGQRALSAAAQ